MLKQDQAAELLRRCESITGKRLSQTRGNLSKPETRAAAVWELLVLEAASYLGKVEYEPEGKSCPDVQLIDDKIGLLWIEAAFLYPRFWKNDRKSSELTRWVYEEARNRGVDVVKISYKFYGDENHKAGPVKTLPELHEKKAVIGSSEFSDFFQKIKEHPDKEHHLDLSNYTFSLNYNPKAAGPYVTGSGVVEEAPKSINEHALYRALREKADQHKLNAPYIVCVGSDQSSALNSYPAPFGIRESDAIVSIFRKYPGVSAVLVVNIESEAKVLSGFRNVAKPRSYINDKSIHPLSEAMLEKIKHLNFNRWKYSFNLQKWDPENKDIHKRIGGNLALRSTDSDNIVIEVPAKLVIESLAGRTNLIREYSRDKNDRLGRWLDEGWIIKSCTLKEGDIEKGEDAVVVFEFCEPPEEVYWPEKRST